MDLNIELGRLAYGERIIRCTSEDPRLMEDFLSLDGQLKRARMWLAFASAKRQGNPDPVRALLAYLLSRTGPLNRDKQTWLVQQIERERVRLADLTIEMLVGTYLEWKHVFKLAGKQFNPTREKQRVKQIYETWEAEPT